MKSKLLFTLSALAFGGWFILHQSNLNSNNMPAPTDGTTVRLNVDEGENQGNREAWIESMHRTAPGTDWRAKEYENQFQRHQKNLRLRAENPSRTQDCVIESFSNDSFQAEWRERGSVNQAGSVLATEFVSATESIYLVSAGGTLWKGDLEGTKWEVINQDLRFDGSFLKVVDAANGPRILATTAGIPHYSDDMGLSWNPATGVPHQGSSGSSRKGKLVEVGGNPVVYILSKSNNGSSLKLYISEDLGESYTVIESFGSSSYNNVVLTEIKGREELMVIEKNNGQTFLYLVKNTDEVEQIQQITAVNISGQRANLQAVKIDDLTNRLFIYDNDLRLWTSDDMGANWIQKGILPTRPWDVSLFVSEKNPDLLLYGEVECYRSRNGGEEFFKVNSWGDYYGDVVGSLHADIMFFTEVTDHFGLDFILVSNHGGLSISIDELATTQNITLAGLNVSQYYDVATDPRDSRYIYAGSQDQGFQRAKSSNETDPLNFEQVISGDYGHTAFSEQGRRLWTVYPGGWVTYYDNPHNSGNIASWELNSNDESVWIPPLVSGPNPDLNEVYMAGGNVFGGNGSFLIRLFFDEQSGTIKTDMDAYDFKSVSVGGEISYIAFSPVNPDNWYISTTNGRFFYSTDAGENWDQNPEFLAGSHYLYGAAIHPSETDENTVYYGGSGYNNPGVFVSNNNGFSFVPMSDGLPATMVFELDGNEDDSKIFAATEAGPYVYNQEEGLWFDLATTCLPTQTYWSVEYLENKKVARFGTYGRGIWDLAIQESVATQQVINAKEQLKIFPNPSNGLVNVELPAELSDHANVQVYSMDGSLVFERTINDFQTVNQLDLSNLAKGTYEISILTRDKRFGQQVVLQ